MAKVWIRWVSLVTVMAAASCPAATVYDDTFTAGTVGPQWTPLNEGGLSLSQSGGHLNLLSTGTGAATDDALYLSTFRLSTASDFSVSIKYVLDGPSGNGVNGDRLGLTFGVGRDLPDGTDSAAIGVGYGNVGGFVATASTAAYRVDDVQTSGPTEPFSPLTGTLAIGYVSATDTLTLQRVGSTFSYTLPSGTVRGTGPSGWGADEVIIAFGGRGSGLSSAAGDLYLDDFMINSGVVTPEPTCVAILGMAAVAGLRRRRVSPSA